MKKTIIVEFLLLFVFAVLLYFCICHLLMFSDLVKIYNSNDKTLSFAEEFGYSELIKGIISLLACIADITGIILIALTHVKPITAIIEARKLKRAQLRTERAHADKQAKIAELEAKLEELKKDE